MMNLELLHRFVAMSALVSAMAIASRLTFTTPQSLDSLEFGDNTFAIQQSPMLGYWSFNGEKNVGKIKAPLFDFDGSGNWSGYKAVWEVRNSKLFLKSISGKIGGVKRRNAELLIDKKFPVEATWFTGRIEIPVGGVEDDGFAIAIIQFQIEKGHVEDMSFVERGKMSTSWNGSEKSETFSSRDDTKQ